MKKYILPTLISLTLSSSWALADEPPTTEPPASAPAVTQPLESVMDIYQEMREKKTAYMQEIQALREKLRQAADSEEWQRLRDEMQRLRNEMRQQMQEMREKMWKEGRMMPGGPYGRSPYGRFGPRWGGPHYGPGPNYFNAPYGGPGWMQGGPNYDRQGGMPEMPRPDYNMPYEGRGEMPKGFDKKMPLGHHAKMEQHLENIEKLLQELVEQLKLQNGGK